MTILKWIMAVAIAFIGWQIFVTITAMIANAVIGVLGFVLAVAALVAGVLAAAPIIEALIALVAGVAAGFIAVVGPILLAVAIVAGAVALLYFAFKNNFGGITTTVQQLWYIIQYYFNQISNTASQLIYIIKYYFQKGWNDIVSTVHNIDWAATGRGIIDGIANGISGAVGNLITAARNAALEAYYAVLDTLGMHSPSKLFMEVGALSMEGMAIGIQKYAGLAADSMAKAMGQVVAPALQMTSMAPSTISTSNQNNYNYNLTVNSSASQEPILQDYQMMQSLT